MIQTCQALGLTLNEIKAFLTDLSEHFDNDGLITYLRRQQARLREKAAELIAMTNFLEAKVAWIENGKVGAMPDIKAFTLTSSSIH